MLSYFLWQIADALTRCNWKKIGPRRFENFVRAPLRATSFRGRRQGSGKPPLNFGSHGSDAE